MARKIYEVTEQEAEFCKLRSQGHYQSDAYRLAFDRPRMKQTSIIEAASRLSKKPQCVAMMKELFVTVKKSVLLSAAAHLDSVLTDLQSARDAENWTAVSSLQRIAGQAIGNLSETINIGDDRMSDEQLLDRLAAGNPELAASLKRAIGGRETFH